jgi:hypothetical protein
MFRRLLSEWRLPMFSTTDTNGKVIDLKATFNPSPEKGYIAVKAVFLVFNTFAVVNSIWVEEPSKVFWLAFLTHWATIVSTLYLISSFLVCLLVRSFPQDTTLRSVNIAWGLFTAAVNLELFVAILYWTLVYEKGSVLLFRTIYEHGILLFVVGLDGYIIHRIPIRWKQIMLVYTVLISYLIWTGIHAISGIGNPTKADSDPETDDDALYGSLNWNERPQGSGILATLLITVAVPLMFLLTWSISICIPRRYSSDANTNNKQLGSESGDAKSDSGSELA